MTGSSGVGLSYGDGAGRHSFLAGAACNLWLARMTGHVCRAGFETVHNYPIIIIILVIIILVIILIKYS